MNNKLVVSKRLLYSIIEDNKKELKEIKYPNDYKEGLRKGQIILCKMLLRNYEDYKE